MLELIPEHQETPSHGGFGWGSKVLSEGAGDLTCKTSLPRNRARA